MDLVRKRKDSKSQVKKDKKLKKLINKSDSDSDESEHELSYYLNDRVKLMKEVLKIIKPKKIRAMAPDCIKNLDVEEINSMLLEELLGISNKRLKYIFNGQNLEEDSSSTDPEVEQHQIDVISLDDITDDEFVIDLDSDQDKEKKKFKRHKPKIKEEHKKKKIKKEKQDKSDSSKSSKKSKEKSDEQNLMSVLELLELQARARAIRSQLALETSKKAEEQQKNEAQDDGSDNDDAIIIESPKNVEIVITSSESENEQSIKRGSKNKNASPKTDKACSGHETNKNSHKNNDLNNIANAENQSEKTCDSSDNCENDKHLNNPGNYEGKKLDSTDTNLEEKIENISTEKEKSGENRDSKKSNNKITNIETVIISPAKIVAKEEKNEKYVEQSKQSNLEECENKANEEPSKNKENSTVSEMSATQNVDEGDGIIINVEQYEIDCIISD